jgi:hypothetical protein
VYIPITELRERVAKFENSINLFIKFFIVFNLLLLVRVVVLLRPLHLS